MAEEASTDSKALHLISKKASDVAEPQAVWVRARDSVSEPNSLVDPHCGFKPNGEYLILECAAPEWNAVFVPFFEEV